MMPIRILLVEDNEGDILLTMEAFEEARIANHVDIVRDGSEAIAFLERKGKYENVILPNLILLDINLPKRNGHEVLHHIKCSEALKQIPVIMLTTSSTEKDVQNAYKEYANCYIVKPVDVNDFIEVVIGIEDFWLSIVNLPINKSSRI